jgi:hypothetical protein
MNVPCTTTSRVVIWEDAYVAVLSEDQLALNDLLKKGGFESLHALHGIEAVSLEARTNEMESILLKCDLGLIAHGYWSPTENDWNSIPESVLEQSVEVLQLSVRPRNCLLNMGIATIGELIQTSRGDLLRTRNMGKKSLDEIYQRLSRLDMKVNSEARMNEFVSDSFSLALLLPFETCGIPKQIAKHLHDAGIHDILDLVGRRADIVGVRARLDSADLQTLQTRLLAHGLRMGSRPPDWITRHLKECRSAFANDTDRIIGTNSVASSEPVFAQPTSPPASCLEEELEAILSPRAREKWLPIVRRVLGWDGGTGSTLEIAGQEFGLTRERIRQIVSKPLQNRPSHAMSFLNRAIEAIG